ncbi:Uncharacterised protein [Bordetella pertussis]|nr:Uncharacterised protein [Bordetella pertussis]
MSFLRKPNIWGSCAAKQPRFSRIFIIFGATLPPPCAYAAEPDVNLSTIRPLTPEDAAEFFNAFAWPPCARRPKPSGPVTKKKALTQSRNGAPALPRARVTCCWAPSWTAPWPGSAAWRAGTQ